MQRRARCGMALEFPVPAFKTVMTADRSTASVPMSVSQRLASSRMRFSRQRSPSSWLRLVNAALEGYTAKCMPSCAGMPREGANESARMRTSYVLSTACATASKARKRGLLQTFRDALSRRPDRTIVNVNCGTAARSPRNMLLKTAICVRYQAGGRSRACGPEAEHAWKSSFSSVETRPVANPASSSPRNLESGNSGNPAEAPAPAQRPTVDLTALTNRDDFLLELGEAL